jgi:uncharacterized membrane protein
MESSAGGWNLGRRVAPPRFVAFVVILIVGLIFAIPSLGLGRGVMTAFDVGAAVFLVSVATLLPRGKAEQMRRATRANDANRAVLLGFTGVTTVVILVAVAKELEGKNDATAIALVIGTLVLAWLFSNTVYALHYAHLFYIGDDAGKDAGGLDIPDCAEPDYWDFIYFSFTLGMTFQTSDVQITSRRIRRVTIGHCLAAFVFNLGVLAFTINVLGGGGGDG